MKVHCTVLHSKDGRWMLRHDSPEIGRVEVTAATRDQATEKLRGEIRYRLELCPCSGESYQHITIEVLEGED